MQVSTTNQFIAGKLARPKLNLFKFQNEFQTDVNEKRTRQN